MASWFNSAFSVLVAGAGLLTFSPHCEGLDFAEPVEAEVELEELVESWRLELERNPEASSRDLGATLFALGAVKRSSGKARDAVADLTEAVALLKLVDLPLATDAKEALALTWQDLGELRKAERQLRKVLAKRHRARQLEHDAALAATLDHLALNQLYQGRYERVKPLLTRALAAVPPAELDLKATILSHRGRLEHTLGSYSRAIGTFTTALDLPPSDPELQLLIQAQRALAELRAGRIDAARLGMQEAIDRAREFYHRDQKLKIIPFLNNRGGLEMSEGNPFAARAAFSEAVGIARETLGEGHPGLIQPLNNLGVAEQSLGAYDAARIHFEAAAEIQRRHLPPVHLRVAETSRNLARNAILAGNPDANERIVAATEIGLRLLDRLIDDGTEKERLNFLQRFDLISLPCASGDAGLIANTLLASKARLLDAMIATHQSQVRVSWKAVQATLPPDSVYVDLCRYQTISDDPVASYGAIIIRAEGLPTFIRLGSEKPILAWLAGFRQRLDWLASGSPGLPPPLKMKGVLRELDRLVWEPIAAEFPATTTSVAISPDGALHFLPLAALLDAAGMPLAKRIQMLTTVSSGRDLMVTTKRRKLASDPWLVVTVSDFPRPVASGLRQSSLASLLGALEPMPGTRLEARKLRKIAPRKSVFIADDEVRERRIIYESSSPAVLHLGCHSFFTSDERQVGISAIDFDDRPELLFSGGLVLYRGVEQGMKPGFVPSAQMDDDILFPTEIAKLNLDDTRLVTLSSCESGVGTPVSGEGLLGLRRGFALAGVKETVVALWPVSDRSTPEFMERFYKLALQSNRPAQALWQAQGEFFDASMNDETRDFELAVLRYAPFIISQIGSLETGDIIVPKRYGNQWWQWVLALLLTIVLVAQFRHWWRRS